MRDSKESAGHVCSFMPECSCVKAAPSVCQICGDDLDLHQPDCEMPDRLLGTCGGCKTWYLLNDDQEWVEIPSRRRNLNGAKGPVPRLPNLFVAGSSRR